VIQLRKKFIILFLTVFLSAGYGCVDVGKGTSSFYINQQIDFSFIKKVAVLPLDNLTPDKNAGEVVRHVVITELLATGLVEVVVPGDSITAIQNLKVKPGTPLNAAQIKSVGKALKVQGVILGAVEKYGVIKQGNVSAPEVTITLMMADTSSGSIVWSVTKTRGGSSFWQRNFGTRSDTMSETVLEVVREALETLFEYGA
jgi:TolB-like protein